MDLQPTHHQEATSSASAVPTSRHDIPEQDQYSTQSSDSKALRSSARVKAAKQKSEAKAKANDRPRESTTQQPEATSSSITPDISVSRPARTANVRLKRSRESSSGKGKARAAHTPEESSARPTRRTRRNNLSTSPTLTINEPLQDAKGKKRAIPDTYSDGEDTTTPASKHQKTSYSLRSSTQSTMPRKTRTLAKDKAASAKTKHPTAGSSKIKDDDVEMLDASYKSENEVCIEQGEEPTEELSDGHDDDDDDEREPVERDEGGGDGDALMSSSDGPPAPSSMDASSAMAMFGDYRQFGSFMMSLSSRLKTMLNGIKPTADPTTRLVTLQELSELLSISTEDTLAGSFQVEQFVRELVKILGGRGIDEDDDDDEEGDKDAEQEDDPVLVAALGMSTGNAYQGDDNLEAQVLACRCLANLMEALPGVAHTVVYHGAIPVLCSKLTEISYIDLAEQTLSTMEKISEEFPSAIVREGGLAALLNYLDFFSIAVQRTALHAAANCCRNVASEHFSMIKGVWPIIRNCLNYSDQRLVEFACLCVIRVVDSYHRASTENLEALVDADLIRAVNQLLLPAGGSPLIAQNTYTLLLRALATSARASPLITITLLEADIVGVLYQILTGVLPSAVENGEEQGGANSGQGLGGGLADMTIMENLAYRPKDQVEEALSLVSELMPPLPRDGVFDHKGYTEKSLARMMKAKAKANRAAARHAVQEPLVAAELHSPAHVSLEEPSPDLVLPETPGAEPIEESNNATTTPPTPLDRTEMLRSKPAVVGRFMQFMVPILTDVYAASVITPVRIKTLTGLLKAVSFLDADGLRHVLIRVPIASFASSILSSKDHPTLVIGALQLVDLLLTKVPSLYKPSFRREGVFYEIDALAARLITSGKTKEKEKDKELLEPESSRSSPAPPVSSATIPGFKKLSSLSLEPEDAITLRARVIQFRFSSSDMTSEEDNAFASLRRLVDRISDPQATEDQLSAALRDLAQHFASPYTSVSSFELLQSGVVEGLLHFATEQTRKVDISKRQEFLLNAFSGHRTDDSSSKVQSPFTILVKKLQESLTRMESFDVVTVAQSVDDSKRSPPSLLARQLRLRLVAEEDSEVPRNLQNIVVSIHAIATFQALHDYLRPRVAGLLNSGSRLHGMLAALAASGFTNTRLGSSDPQTTSKPAPPVAETGREPVASGSTSAVGRRRSQRLRAKNAVAAAETINTDDGSPSVHQDSTIPKTTSDDGPSIEAAPSETVVDSELQADFTDDEDIEAEVFDDDEVDPDQSVSDKTVMLSVAEDGSKVEAQTPDGTRVATPNSTTKDGPSHATSKLSLSTRASYAAALKTKPTDWHLEFSMDDHILPLDLTIYGAIHQHEIRKKADSVPPNVIWQSVYTIKFKKVLGPAILEPREGTENNTKSSSSNPTLTSLPEDAPHAKILRLLRVLHQLNTMEAERSIFLREKRNLPESAFVNNKLTAKLTRQLEEPMIVASSCLPDWALDLPQHFPFLFPFATRYNFLQSTSFGYARLILKWQSQQSRAQDNTRRDEGIGFLGRLQRQKVRISRKHILESAVKVFELYGSSSSILEVEYFEEVGTGLGPTLEFYSLVSKDFARKDLKIWRDSDPSSASLYVGHPSGLYPTPLNPEDVANDGGQKRTHLLRVIGQFIAKAMLDSRIIDLTFNTVFLKLVLGEVVPITIDSLKLVDIELAKSLEQIKAIKAMVSAKSSDGKGANEPTTSIEDLALDFTVPGYDIELKPGGRDISVTSENVDEYIEAVLDAILGKGVEIQAKALKEGFSKVFPITDLRAFSADELAMLFGNSDEDWSIETLTEALKADHGFNVESRAIHDLVEILSTYDIPTRRAFLQFVTGSPKLPIGGFRGLNPLLTVVRKPHEAPLTADDYLPSVMTCVNYLKLPEYSSRTVMREKLRMAIQEGVGSFHLS